jgi:hypothetical protein
VIINKHLNVIHKKWCWGDWMTSWIQPTTYTSLYTVLFCFVPLFSHFSIHVCSHLLKGLASEETKLIEACLRCLRTIFEFPCAPVGLVCETEDLPLHLLSLIPHCVSNQVCVSTVLAAGCKVWHSDICHVDCLMFWHHINTVDLCPRYAWFES